MLLCGLSNPRVTRDSSSCLHKRCVGSRIHASPVTPVLDSLRGYVAVKSTRHQLKQFVDDFSFHRGLFGL